MALENKVKFVLEEVADIVKQDLINNVENRLYDAWTPSTYDRTGELLKSITRTEVKKVFGKYTTTIYFDSKVMQPYYREGEWYAHASIVTGEWISENLAYWIEEGTEGSPYYNHDGIYAVRDTVKWITEEFDRLFREHLKIRGIKFK